MLEFRLQQKLDKALDGALYELSRLGVDSSVESYKGLKSALGIISKALNDEKHPIDPQELSEYLKKYIESGSEYGIVSIFEALSGDWISKMKLDEIKEKNIRFSNNVGYAIITGFGTATIVDILKDGKFDNPILIIPPLISMGLHYYTRKR